MKKSSDADYFRLKIASALGLSMEEMPPSEIYTTAELKRHTRELWQLIERICAERGLRLERVEVAYRIYKAILSERLSRMEP